MKYKIYKLKFQTAVHFGDGNLDSSGYGFSADTLFSALCIEALKYGTDTFEEFLNTAKMGEICFSDAFPYMGKQYFLPKPMIRVENEANSRSSVVKKAFKQLKFVPAEDYQVFLSGKYNVLDAVSINDLGCMDMKTSVAIRGHEETEPYRVGMYRFGDNNGLYIIVGYEREEQLYLVEDLLLSLQYSGIGGKRTSGYGRFELVIGKLPEILEKGLNGKGKTYITLSGALPREDELAECLEGASYLLEKKSGFVASAAYSDSQLRKKDLYVFKSGSCFKKTFKGDIYDVSTKEGSHPVYRYAKPLFMGVNV